MRETSRVQRIRRVSSVQWYVPVPAEVARALQLVQGEVVEWEWGEDGQAVLRRPQPAAPAEQKGAPH